jgi:hypothetical protein
MSGTEKTAGLKLLAVEGSEENHIRCISVKRDEGNDRFVRGAGCSLRFVERESVWTSRQQGREPLPRSLAPQPSPESRARERASRAAPLVVQEADDGRLQHQFSVLPSRNQRRPFKPNRMLAARRGLLVSGVFRDGSRGDVY